MKTDVLFVHHQLAFAVSIKQALERTGSYDVHPFTSVEAALEYLRGHTQDVALVDFMMPVYSGEEIVERLRQVQAQIAVVATPTQTEAEFARVGLQGMLNAAFTAREFIPVIERALEGRRTGELPTPTQKAGLLDRVQPDSDTGNSAPEKRPPTSVIGYRSLESILDQGAAAPPLEPEPQADAPTLVEGLPAARPVDDLSFLNDVVPPASAAPEVRINTERLADMDKFKSDEFPELLDEPKGVTTDSFKGVTEPLPDDLFDLDEDEVDTPSSARPPAQPYGAPPEPLKRVTKQLPEESFDFDEDMFAEQPAVPVMAEDVPWSEGGSGTRPLPDLEFEDEAEVPGQAAADAGLESLSSKLRERDLFGTRPLEDADDAAYDLFGEPQIDVLAVFEDAEAVADEDEQDTPDQPVDYMAALDLKPPAPAEAYEPPPAAPVPEPSEEEVVAGLVALFDNPAADAPAEPELSFEELLRATGQNEDEFADVLGEIAPGEAAARERSPFDDLVASMSAPEQRPPLPARQQQYVDAPLAGETAERDNEEAAPELEDFPFEDEMEDGSAVLFED
ncbi:MAG TPA: response regulator, partial [Candidatus Limnocylindrales bacterium]|nr:response regulator [Candidatus Limnocylindrales bacterium]